MSASSRDDDEFRSTRSDPYDSSALSSPGGGEVLSLETVMKDGVSHAAQYEQQLMSLEVWRILCRWHYSTCLRMICTEEPGF